MEMVDRGRKMVIAMIAIVLIMDIATVAIVSSIYATNGMTDMASFKLLQGIFRFILTGLLLLFLYKGHRWAKWLSLVLYIIAGLMALISLMATFNFLILLMGVVYVLLGAMIGLSRSVNKFFLYQKGVYIPNSGESIDNQGVDSRNTQL